MPPPAHAPPHNQDGQVASAVRFSLRCQNWTNGLGFSEMAGFSSAVAHQEYSYNGKMGNVLTRQLGRPSAPTISLKGALDKTSFVQLFTWHKLARDNDPKAKVAATFTISDAGGRDVAVWKLNQAWCAKLEMGAAQAGSSNVILMTVTIECDEIEP